MEPINSNAGLSVANEGPTLIGQVSGIDVRDFLDTLNTFETTQKGEIARFFCSLSSYFPLVIFFEMMTMIGQAATNGNLWYFGKS